MENFLEVKNLSIDLSLFQLNEVSFSLRKGDFLAIIGPTGAGKTILLESLLGIYPLKEGRILLKNVDISILPPEKRKIGIIYQDYALFPHLNVYKNIEYGLNCKNSEKVKEISKLLNIEHLLDRMPDTLSGGEKQRVALARALIVEPEIILMDEPFSALDNVSKFLIRQTVKKISERFNITIILVTHDLDDVWGLANKVAVVRKGSLLQFGTVEDIMYRPKDDFIAGFIDTNILEGVVNNCKNGITSVKVGNFLIFSAGNVDKGKKVKLAFRPEDLIIFKNKPKELSARNVLKGTIADFYIENKIFHIMVKIGEVTIKAILTKNAFEELDLEKGRLVYVVIKATNVRLV
jgi:molybdate transport system ATP-binding protein